MIQGQDSVGEPLGFFKFMETRHFHITVIVIFSSDCDSEELRLVPPGEDFLASWVGFLLLVETA